MRTNYWSSQQNIQSPWPLFRQACMHFADISSRVTLFCSSSLSNQFLLQQFIRKRKYWEANSLNFNQDLIYVNISDLWTSRDSIVLNSTFDWLVFLKFRNRLFLFFSFMGLYCMGGSLFIWSAFIVVWSN